MKILVLSCSTGGGHNSCGRYIKEEFNANNIACDFVDYFSILGNKLSKRIEKLYLKSTKGKGNIFKSVYKLGEVYNKMGLISPVYELNKLGRQKVLKFIKTNGYDLIICSHLFPAMALTALKKEGYDLKLINVATDYTNIPFWNETNPDYFVIPHESLKESFTSKGILASVLLPLGIPVSSHFQIKKSSLNFATAKPKVLITSGSMGFGDLEKIVKEILAKLDIYLIVICGNNKKLYNKLKKINNANLMVKGFINNMNEYILASDLVLTKPGGLTSTEVAVLNKPLIHIMPIPGVENYNAAFFEEHNLSLVAHNIDDIILDIDLLLKDKDRQKEMLIKQREFINKKAAQELVEFVKNKF